MQTTAIQPHKQSVTAIVYCQSSNNDLTSSWVIRKVFSDWESISRICACQAFCPAYTTPSSSQHLCSCTEKSQK